MFKENDALEKLPSIGDVTLHGNALTDASFEKLKHDTNAEIGNNSFEKSAVLEVSRTATVAEAVSPAITSLTIRNSMSIEPAGTTLMMLTTLENPCTLAVRVTVEPLP